MHVAFKKSLDSSILHLPLCGSMELNSITRLVREHLYPVRHFVGPIIVFNYILKTKRSKEGNVLLNHIVKIDGAFFLTKEKFRRLIYKQQN